MKRLMTPAVAAVALATACCASVHATDRRSTPAHSHVGAITSEAAAIEAISGTRANAIEGIWASTDTGIRIAIVADPDTEPYAAGEMLMVVVDSPTEFIVPGTVCGRCHAAAKPGYYECTMFTDISRPDRLTAPRRFTLHLLQGSHLSMVKERNGVEISVLSLVPYLGRAIRKYRQQVDPGLQGLIRLWPENLDNPLRPIHL